MDDFEIYTPDFVTQEFLKPVLDSGVWRITKTIKRRDCLIYKATHADFKSPLCVKIYSAARKDGGTPKALFKALKKYYTADSPLNVPKPFAHHEEYGAVIMEWTNVPARRNIIWKLLVQRRKTIRRAGAWLKWFHQKSETKTSSYNDTAIAKIASIIEYENFTPPKGFMACYEALKSQVQTHQGAEILSGVIHGDFTPYNILHDTQGRMIGIDFTAQENAPLYSDLARFFMYLNSYRPIYMSAKADYNALLEGYGMARNNDVHRTVLFGEIMRRWSVLRREQISKPWHLWREIELIRISFMAKVLKKSVK